MEFLLAVLLFGVLIALNFSYIFINSPNRDKSYLNRNLPRVIWYKIRLPILDGYITMLKLRKEGVTLIEDLIRKIGPTFIFPFADSDVIFVSDISIVKKLLTSTEPTHLNKPKIYELILEDGFKDGLFGADYKIWSVHRNAVAPAATYNGFLQYVKFMNESAQNLVKQACDICCKTGDKKIENRKMKELIDMCTLKIITDILMASARLEIDEKDRIEFHHSFHQYKTLVTERYGHPEQFIPIVWKFHPQKKRMDNYISDMNRFSNMIVENYRKINVNSDNSENEDNVLDELSEIGIKRFHCMVEQLIQAGLSNKEIIDEINTLLAAGHETTTVALDMLAFHLARNPECQQKCFEEICEVLENKHNDINKKITMADLTQLKYLEMCVLEGMRLTPTVPFFLRRLDTPLKINEDMEIEAGQVLLLAPWVIHRNPEIYPEPERFDPDRFLPENVKQRPFHSYIPFSSGARNCVGWKIAMMEMKMTMAWILRYFTISTTDHPNDVKLLFDVTLNPERLYNVTFARRS